VTLTVNYYTTEKKSVRFQGGKRNLKKTGGSTKQQQKGRRKYIEKNKCSRRLRKFKATPHLKIKKFRKKKKKGFGRGGHAWGGAVNLAYEI